uniref:Small ribosomal subunit protein mS29 n=1 Tax=Phallusia mammillata TaxID=59560 RepID=A0A6F9DBC2_9ASCI|nr:28S ribosomal protein S29, mitochondrial-like [Phallusia mammillata]
MLIFSMLSYRTAKLCFASSNVALTVLVKPKETVTLKNRKYSNTLDLKPLSTSEPGNFSTLEHFLTDESNPARHTIDDVGLMYTIPKEDYSKMVSSQFNTVAFTQQFDKQVQSLNEASMVIRQPGFEIVNYLQNTDYTAPVNRYVIHGPQGSGKTMLMMYATHFCMKENWLIVPNYNMWSWMDYQSRYKPTMKKEIMESTWNKERVDVPHRAVIWLDTFKLLNGSLLDNIKTTQKYQWSKHESADIGESFSSIVDFGKARVRVATDVIGAIMKEIRVQDASTMPRTLVTVDAVNAAFCETKLKIKHNVYLKAHELSYGHNLKKLMTSSWTNGAVITALSKPFLEKNKKGYLLPGSHPYDLLGQEGFDWLDPHIPIAVGQYTDKEILSQLAYYKDRKFLTGPCLSEAGEAELIQLSYRNPADLAHICLSAS